MVVGEELGCNADVVVVDWRWDDGAFGQGEALASALVHEGCQQCTVAP
jgi:hypothetical protein